MEEKYSGVSGAAKKNRGAAKKRNANSGRNYDVISVYLSIYKTA